MTRSTRRRLIAALVVLGLTIPAETILLRALSTPDYQQSVAEWVASLAPAEVDAAADVVQEYPFQYRREIMAALSADRRSQVWRKHLKRYLAARPDLDAAAVPAIEAAIALASPEMFAGSTPEMREQVREVAGQIELILGRDEAEYLLYRLGPRDGTFASREPLSQKLANYVRGLIVAMAREEDCDCAPAFGCGGAGRCDDNYACTPDTTWPKCGWMWDEDCEGFCVGIMEG